jgi:hypothetical protein
LLTDLESKRQTWAHVVLPSKHEGRRFAVAPEELETGVDPAVMFADVHLPVLMDGVQLAKAACTL